MKSTPIRLLLIEENPSDASFVKKLLSASDQLFAIAWVRDIAQAIQHLGEFNADVILLDLNLPNQRDLKTLKAILGTPTQTPIIAMSRLEDKSFAIQAVRAGAQDYLVKGLINEFSLSRAIHYAIERVKVEEKLTESEARYRDLVENSQDLICTHDLDGKILSINAAVTRNLGYAKDEIIDKNLVEFLTPHSRSQFRLYLLLLQRKGFLNGDIEVVAKNGQVLTWEFNNNLRIRTGEKPIVRGIARDVTEKVQASEGLAQKANQLSKLTAVISALASTLSLDEVLRTILEQIRAVIHIDSAAIFLIEGDHLKIAMDFGFEQSLVGQTVKPNELFSIIAERQKPLNIKQPLNDSRFEQWSQLKLLQDWLGVPLVVRETVIGFLTLNSNQADVYSAEDIQLMMSFATQAAQAIENARLYQNASNQAARLAIINSIGKQLSHTLNLGEICQIARDEIEALVDCPNFGILKYDSETQKISPIFLIGDGHPIDISKLPAINLEPGTGPNSRAILSRKPDIVADFHNQVKQVKTHISVPTEDRRIVQSILTLPLITSDEVIGTLQVQSYKPNSYSPDDIELLSGIASQIALAAQNAAFYQQIQQRLMELEMVNRVSTALRTAKFLDDMLPIFLKETLAILTATVGYITLVDTRQKEVNNQVVCNWFDHFPAELSPFDDGFSEYVIQTDQAYVAAEFATDQHISTAARQQTPPRWGGVCAPIHAGNQIIGILYIAVAKPRQITPGEVKLIETLTEMVGNAIHRSQLYESSQRKIKQLASLRAIDLAISSSTDIRFSTSVLLDQTIEQLGVDAANILVLDPDEAVLTYAGGRGFALGQANMRLRLDECQAGKAALERRLVAIPNISAENDIFQQFALSKGENFSAYFAVPLISKGQLIGVFEVFNRTPLNPNAEWMTFLETLAGEAAIAVDNANLFLNLQQSNQNLRLSYDRTIEGWAKTLELRDNETEGHSQRVTTMALQLARAMNIPKEDLIHIRRGALLHDIGKMGLPDKILHNPGPLNPEEQKIMRQHPILARKLLSSIPYLKPAIDIPYCHHEKWDGSGYPRGLKGEQIPISARIFAIVDVWDALISERPYRSAWAKEKIIAYIRSESGQYFDPQVVTAFLENLPNFHQG